MKSVFLGDKQFLSKIRAKELEMIFTTKALAVAFLTVIVSSQAYSASASLPAQPDQRASFVSASVSGSFLDVAQLNGRSSVSISVFRDGRALVNMNSAKVQLPEAKVPKPGSYAMFLAGLGIIVAMVRRRGGSV